MPKTVIVTLVKDGQVIACEAVCEMDFNGLIKSEYIQKTIPNYQPLELAACTRLIFDDFCRRIPMNEDFEGKTIADQWRDAHAKGKAIYDHDKMLLALADGSMRAEVHADPQIFVVIK